MFPLAIFPEGSLSSSVITTVWVGIWVVCYFNLRLGWVFSGLVIPGYLVPLILVRPLSAVIIIVEALITYFMISIFSESHPKIRKWSSLFGRDRFFALVLTSIAVRLISEAWFVPKLTLWLRANIEGVFILESDLNGYGLIVTSLIANQLWKPGLKKGLFSFSICVGITWAIVRLILMPYTNFSISNLSFMYEDIAASLEAAPKAYIILIVAAFMASRLNLKYGWEFNGILIPSLLALQWYQPIKILSTFIECFLIYGLASLTLKLPIIKDWNMEGARKFLLFFNVGFIYKFGLAHGLIHYYPSFKSSDAFGYGYMLSTLLAIKMHDKKILLKMTRSTLQASLISVIWASLIGYSLSLIVTFFQKPNLQQFSDPNLIVPLIKENSDVWLRNHKLSLQRLREPDSIPSPNAIQKNNFKQLLIYLDKIKDFRELGWQTSARKLAHLCRYEILQFNDDTIALVEKEPKLGWGAYLLKNDRQENFAIQVPAPLEEWSISDSAIVIFNKTLASTLSIAGAGRHINRDGSSDMLKVQDSFFYVFNEHFSRSGVLQIRGLGAEYLKREKGVSKQVTDSHHHFDSELLIHGKVPKSLDLTILSKLFPQLILKWGKTKDATLQVSVSSDQHGELYLNRSDRRKMLFQKTSRETIRKNISPQMISGYLTDLLFDSKKIIADKGSELYISPQLEDLLYLDEEVLTPLIEAVKLSSIQNGLNPEIISILKAVHASAQALGYEVWIYRHEISDEEYIILSETFPAKRYWGTLVLRIGDSTPYHIEVPRPLSEINTLETGTRLFQRHRAEALIIAGAHALANSTGEADPLKRKQAHPFTLFQQILLRENNHSDRMVVQIRALSSNRPNNDSALLASHLGWIKPHQMSTLAIQWKKSLEKDGLPINLWEGDPFDFGGNPWNTPQARYLSATSNQDFYQLWLPPNLRSLFQRQDTLTFEEKVYKSISVITLHDYLIKKLKNSVWATLPHSDRDTQLNFIDSFIESGQVMYIWELQKKFPNLKVERVIDLDSKRAFLLGKNIEDGSFLWLARIDAIDEKLTSISDFKNYSALMDYLNGVSRWLVSIEAKR